MTSRNHPDDWAIVEITSQSGPSVLKIFSAYDDISGVSEKWTLNSGIVSAQKTGSTWRFVGKSGSIYFCDKRKYRINQLMQVVLNDWLERVKKNQKIKIKALTLEKVEKIFSSDGWA